MPPDLEIRPAAPLPFWSRRVVFFSNLHSIFYGNVAATEQLMNEIRGSHSYGGRLITILDLLFHGRPNLIVVETSPDPRLMNYLTDTLGLSLPETAILPSEDYAALAARLTRATSTTDDKLAGRLRDHPAEWVDGFVTDRHLEEIASILGKRAISTLEGSKNGNNKYLLHLHLLKQRQPVFDTHIAADSGELSAGLKKLRAQGYRSAVVKAQIGASGYGMVKLAAEERAAAEVPRCYYFEGPCMVQGWIEDGVLDMKKLASPSVQLFLSDDKVFLFDMTEQILSAESVHQGNASPPPIVSRFPEVEPELWRQASIAAAWLHAQGYRGTASVDFLIVERGGSLETLVCEINARVTGATYPALLARRFNPQGHWLMRNIGFRKAMDGGELLALMGQAGVLFRPGAPAGMIPFNFNTDADGRVLKGQFVCLAEDLEICNDLLARAWARLPVEWDYDRD
jgi:hypothetical protein